MPQQPQLEGPPIQTELEVRDASFGKGGKPEHREKHSREQATNKQTATLSM